MAKLKVYKKPIFLFSFAAVSLAAAYQSISMYVFFHELYAVDGWLESLMSQMVVRMVTGLNLLTIFVLFLIGTLPFTMMAVFNFWHQRKWALQYFLMWFVIAALIVAGLMVSNNFDSNSAKLLIISLGYILLLSNRRLRSEFVARRESLKKLGVTY